MLWKENGGLTHSKFYLLYLYSAPEKQQLDKKMHQLEEKKKVSHAYHVPFPAAPPWLENVSDIERRRFIS